MDTKKMEYEIKIQLDRIESKLDVIAEALFEEEIDEEEGEEKTEKEEDKKEYEQE